MRNALAALALLACLLLPAADAQSVRRRAVFPAGGGPSTYVYDQMTDADSTLITSHSPVTGGAWEDYSSLVSGEIAVIETNVARSGSVGLALSSTAAPSADYDVECDLRVRDTSVSRLSGVVARFSTSAETGYRVRLNSLTAEVRLDSLTAGSPALLGTHTVAGLSNGQTVKVRLRVQGSSIKVFVDGVEQISATNSDHTGAGRFGFWANGTVTTGVNVDNFWAGAVGGTAGP